MRCQWVFCNAGRRFRSKWNIGCYCLICEEQCSAPNRTSGTGVRLEASGTPCNRPHSRSPYLLSKTGLAFGLIENMDVLGSLAKLSERDVFVVSGLPLATRV